MALTVVPNSGQTLNSSRTQISGNFASIDTAFKVDHVEYNLTGQGTHSRVFFAQQAADIPTPNATDAVIYTKAGTGGANSLFYRGPSNATPAEFSYKLANANGYTILPSGIIMQWASGTVGAGQAFINVTLPRAFTNLAAVLNCQVTPTSGAGTSHSSDWIIYAVPSTSQIIRVGRGATHTTVSVGFNLLVIGY